MSKIILHIEEAFDLKGGENSHLKAEVLRAVDKNGKPLNNNEVYSEEKDLGCKARKKGWTNSGDISACLRTTVNLNDIYKHSATPHIAMASKHTRPVVLAKGRTQYEAIVKAIAGDVNSPFGGFVAFNTPLEMETAKFIDKMFIEGVIAPEYEEKTAELLKDTSKIKTHANRFIIQTGNLKPEDLNYFNFSLHPIAFNHFLKQEYEKPFLVRKESRVVSCNDGNEDIYSLHDNSLDNIQFAGNAALYLASNLVFYVHDGAIAGLGDGCGSRVVAATKGRRMLEDSVYAAISSNSDKEWERVLYDTPFNREEFEDVIELPLSLTCFSDAFFPKIDGFIEASGIDRKNKEFGKNEVKYIENKKEKTFIPKKNNFTLGYDFDLIPEIVVQPGGSLGDKMVLPLAEDYNIKMVFTNGRRFFGHIIM